MLLPRNEDTEKDEILKIYVYKASIFQKSPPHEIHSRLISEGKFLLTVSTRLSGPVQNINFIFGFDCLVSQHIAMICSNSTVNSTFPLVHHPTITPSQGLSSNVSLRALSVL